MLLKGGEKFYAVREVRGEGKEESLVAAMKVSFANTIWVDHAYFHSAIHPASRPPAQTNLDPCWRG